MTIQKPHSKSELKHYEMKTIKDFENSLPFYKELTECLKEHVAKQDEQLKVAVEALEFYANMDNWTHNDLGELNQVVASDCGHELNLLGEQPYGNRARTALAKIQGEK
jgi:hypothetical protein